MVVGSMAIKMRELVVEGAKQSNPISIDVDKDADLAIYDGMKQIVSTYQSAFANKSSNFACSASGNMNVSLLSHSSVVSSGKQRFERRQEQNLIGPQKKAKERNMPKAHVDLNMSISSTVQDGINAVELTVVMSGDRKSPPEMQLVFANAITRVNANKKRPGNKCSFCYQVAGHKIDRCDHQEICTK